VKNVMDMIHTGSLRAIVRSSSLQSLREILGAHPIRTRLVRHVRISTERKYTDRRI